MGRILLFAMIGGGLVTLTWLLVAAWLKKTRVRSQQQAMLEAQAQRERQAEQLPGGSPGNALEVLSPSVVEPKAGSMPCVRCQADVRVLEHQVRTVDGFRLRVALVRCASCGYEREVFFRLPSSGAN